jgi:Arc/MetJ-type ribon-helix-helix transcriptional regulator
MKLSVSVPDEDVATLDAYAREQGLRSRSAAVQHAIRLLRHPDLEQDYAAAWDEWAASGEAAAWEASVADGLADAAR